MNVRFLIGFAILVSLAAGCASNPKGQQASNPSTPLTGSEFDQVKDPPIRAKTHFAAGQLAESQGDLANAIAQYQKALSLDPKYADAMFRLGCVLTATRDFPKAIETWNRYVALTQGSATACNNLAFCQELAGNPIAAESAYRKGIERDPTNEPCHVNYGLMLARHGRPNEALLQLQTVLPPAKAHYDLAAVYEQSGRKKEAKAEYAKALELDPNLGDAKAKLAALEQ
jgi:tetratricopeptide (TPR) repeat protein